MPLKKSGGASIPARLLLLARWSFEKINSLGFHDVPGWPETVDRNGLADFVNDIGGERASSY